jgi:hypothetical protein
MGFAERRAGGNPGTPVRMPEHPTRRVLIPSSHDLACFVEPLAIRLDPTEPSGDMDYAFSPGRTRQFLGERFPGATVFGLFLAHGGLQMMNQANRANNWLTKHGGTHDL